METGITYEKKSDTYTVTAGDKTIITTHVESGDLQLIKHWIREVQLVYGKRSRQNVVVALSADRSTNNYSNVPYIPLREKDKRKGDAFELLQLCIGRHCLLYELDTQSHDLKTVSPKALKDFFYDRRITFVGVGIEQIASKLERDHGFLIQRKVELRDLAEAMKKLEGKEYAKYNILRLARAVLGEEFNVEKPKTIRWCDPADGWNHGHLSDDMIKYATIEAFLSYEMGSKLLLDY